MLAVRLDESWKLILSISSGDNLHLVSNNLVTLRHLQVLPFQFLPGAIRGREGTPGARATTSGRSFAKADRKSAFAVLQKG